MNFKNTFIFLIFFTQNIFAIPYFADYKANDAYKNKDYKKAKDIREKYLEIGDDKILEEGKKD